jgi:trehalose synthase
VIGGSVGFCAITKRLHNRLHGFDGDGGPLGEQERSAYEATLAPNADALRTLIRPGDAVILHDPQTAGLIGPIRALGVPVVWRCHVGVDTPNAVVRQAWRFLEPYVRLADAVVFSREAFAWDVVDVRRRVIISPSIDAFSAKNQALGEPTVESILAAAGPRAGRAGRPAFTRMDGSPDVVHRRATTIDEHRLRAEDRYVLQSRVGMCSRTRRASLPALPTTLRPAPTRTWFMRVPPWRRCQTTPRARPCLRAPTNSGRHSPSSYGPASTSRLLPMDDLQENAAMVNALQRGADVVVHKSVAEGFGLTVAEAMWKARPVVASRLGGIQDQIEHRVSGVLLDDPLDLRAFGTAVSDLLNNPAAATTMGAAAAQRVRSHFLAPHSLLHYSELLRELLSRSTNGRYPTKKTNRRAAMEEIGSYRIPNVEHARVSDAMNKGVVGCSRGAGLREMGRLMASRHIHSLVISLSEPARWALVSDIDIAQSAIRRPEATAEDLAVAATGISDEATLDRAIEVMRAQGTSHLIVTDNDSGQPTGMISALDIAGVVGWGEA